MSKLRDRFFDNHVQYSQQRMIYEARPYRHLFPLGAPEDRD